MAERVVSPGVFTRERDLSFLEQGVANIGAAFVGVAQKGPAFVPVVVDSQTEFENRFGKADEYRASNNSSVLAIMSSNSSLDRLSSL